MGVHLQTVYLYMLFDEPETVGQAQSFRVDSVLLPVPAGS